MSLTKFNRLYQTIVLDHAAHPRNFGTLDSQTANLVLRNPSCGDIINVQIQIIDDSIADIKLRGTGCTISMASASMMSQVVKHHSIQEAQQMITAFLNNIMGKTISNTDEQQLGDAFVLSTVANFPTRIRCATLSWHALADLITKK